MANVLELCLSSGCGGLELYVPQCITALKQMGHHVFAITRNDTFLQKRIHLPHHESLKKRGYFYLLGNARFIAHFCDRHHIDVIHINWGHDLATAALAKYWCKRPVKLIYSRHMGITRAKKDILHRLLYRQVDKMFLITQEMWEQAREFIPLNEEQLQLLHLGVSVENKPIDTLLLKDIHWKADSLSLGLFARITYLKGQHLLIEAMRLLKEQGIPAQVLMIGHVMEEDYKAQLDEQIIAAGLEDCVHFLGFQENATRYMQHCDAVVLSTYHEAFGLVLPEAMTLGIPVVGSAAGGVLEIIEHDKTGLLFESGNAGALAMQLQRLYADPAWRSVLAKAGQEKALRDFSLTTHFERLQTFFTV